MSAVEQSKVLLSEKRGHIGIITFNRPEQHNALSPELLGDLCAVLADWATSGDVRVVVFTGAGDKAFSAGYDINAIATVGPEHRASLEKGRASSEQSNKQAGKSPLDRGLEAVKNFPYPTIAMLNGHCFGGALHLALCCDIRIAADHISMAMPPAKLGVVYGADGLLQFIQVLGTAKGREMFFTGRTYKGEHIAAMGLAGQLVPAEQLASTVFAMAEDIALNAPLALRGIKRIMNIVELPALSEAMHNEAHELVAESFRSSDLKEGQAAFLEKRKPVFRGE
ncbi:MAG: enoyl-CoA hydratase/isomerase family protein [Gammaproteobacteria bacterium]|nr:enoyl-CoA hydratase/isomerase family protein [Gammaproteobacteria bacterium]MBQ0838244.1 enoyl-CoA hydratase/isomerase family protein [Gammaproteobacteria bacterium]